MDSIVVSAKTVEDALTEASIQLGTSRDNIEYTVIDGGSKGLFFGIGGRNATIEAKKKVTDEDLMKEIFEDKPQKAKKEPKKEERKESRKENRESKADTRSEAKSVTKSESKTEKKEARKEEKKEVKDSQKDYKKESKRESKKEKEDGRKESFKAVDKEAEREEAKKAAKDLENPDKTEITEKSGSTDKAAAPQSESAERSEDTRGGYERRNRGRRDFDRKDRKPAQYGSREKGARVYDKNPDGKSESVIASEVTESKEEVEEVKVPKTPADPEEAKARAVDFLKQVLHTMGMEVEVKAEFEDGILCLDIEGEDMGIMIGKRGQTLDSLQYLTSLVVNKGKDSYVRVKLDTEDYRNRRKATLENLAKNIAYKVKKTRRPVFLEPMNPYERRIIHSALQNDPYVTTHSEGEEPYRKVVVTLKRDRDRGNGGGYSRYNNNRRGRYNRENREFSDIDHTQSEFAQTEETSSDQE
ncbi:MAG: protein jag [Lachnospiraceae bacterium]|nr:protein jag [Lachnospiraceae bacterium]